MHTHAERGRQRESHRIEVTSLNLESDNNFSIFYLTVESYYVQPIKEKIISSVS